MQIDLGGLGLGPRFYISIHLPSEADALGPWTDCPGSFQDAAEGLENATCLPNQVNQTSGLSEPVHYTIPLYNCSL